MSNNIVIFSKKTLYSTYQEDDKEFLSSDHPIIERWKRSHETHNKTLDCVCDIVSKYAQLFIIESPNTSIVDLEDVDLVVTVGGDGTLLNASHNVHQRVPVLGVNSDPSTSVGFFCAATRENFNGFIHRALNDTFFGMVLTRMKVIKNNCVVESRVLNDVLFCHRNPATTSSYILHTGEHIETQKSSGFWVGPAAGSTAARRSAGFNSLPLGSKSLQLCVRELYYRPNSEPGRREIIAESGEQIHVTSKMDLAAMYIDGDHKVVPVGLGDELIFEKSDDSLFILGKPDVLRQ
jgi:NAD+ kinase